MTIDCVLSTFFVAKTIQAIVYIASIGCKSSILVLTIDCVGSSDVIGGRESVVGSTLSGIVSVTVVSNGSSEITQRTQVIVEGILISVIASTVDRSSDGTKWLNAMAKRIGINANAWYLSSVVSQT